MDYVIYYKLAIWGIYDLKGEVRRCIPQKAIQSQSTFACIVLDKRIIELQSRLIYIRPYHVFIHCIYDKVLLFFPRGLQ